MSVAKHVRSGSVNTVFCPAKSLSLVTSLAGGVFSDNDAKHDVCQDTITFTITFATSSDFGENMHVGTFQPTDYKTEVWLLSHQIF